MDIKVKERGTNMGWRFTVTLEDKGILSTHEVSMDKDFVMRIGSSYRPEKIIEKSFEFLLERKPKEEILQEFDISLISHYFPDFITELEKKLEF